VANNSVNVRFLVGLKYREVTGHKRQFDGDNFPEAHRGNGYFFANEASQAELRRISTYLVIPKQSPPARSSLSFKPTCASAPEPCLTWGASHRISHAANSAVIAQLDRANLIDDGMAFTETSGPRR